MGIVQGQSNKKKGAAEMEKEKKWARKGQRLLAKLGAACISEKGNGRPVGFMDLHLMWETQ
jgi:cytochrome c